MTDCRAESRGETIVNVIIEKEYDINPGFDMESVVREVIDKALDYVKCPYETEVYVTLTDNKGIHEINLEQREIDSPTDVLSFPNVSYETPGDFSVLDDDYSCFNPETGELMLGDIVVSLDKVVSQAEEYNHSTKRELAFLIAHSMLHLSGYDHINDGERKEMERMQEEILTELGITREV